MAAHEPPLGRERRRRKAGGVRIAWDRVGGAGSLAAEVFRDTGSRASEVFPEHATRPIAYVAAFFRRIANLRSGASGVAGKLVA